MEKTVDPHREAPAPFQGAPYNQAIRVGELVFVAGQLGLKPGDTAVEGDVAAQTEQALRNLAAILEAAGSSLDEPRQDERVPPGSRRLRRDERGLRAPRRRPAAGPLDVRGRGASLRRARRDRGRRPHLSEARLARCRPAGQNQPHADRDPRLHPLARHRRLRRRGRRPRRAARHAARATRTSSSPASTRRACARCSSRTAASRTWRCTASSSACGSSRATGRSGRSSRPGSS